MFSMILCASLIGQAGPGPTEPKSLLATIESLQRPIKDFRCEFEGSLTFRGKVAEDSKGKLGEDGLAMGYAGVYIWKQGGDVHVDTLELRPGDGPFTRNILVVRTRENKAERHLKYNDGSIGPSEFLTLDKLQYPISGTYGSIFLIDKMKHEVAGKGFEASVEDDQIDGRPLKVLSLKIKTLSWPIFRYWIDLARNGHVVRQESYQSEKVGGRLDVTLAQFKIGDENVWMPVSGEGKGYVALKDKKVIVVKEPTSIDSIHVIDGTMQFNKNVGPNAFTVNYRLGTPISGELRAMEAEFALPKLAPKPAKPDPVKLLNEKLAEVDREKSELVAEPPSHARNWWPMASGGMGVLVLISLVAAWIQRRSH